MKETRKHAAVLALAVGFAACSSVPLLAQTSTTTTSSTCTTAPTTLTALSIERVLTLSNILTTLTPNVSPATLAAITGGAQEIRTRLIYNATANTITDTTFLVASGSPIPTPLSVDVTGTTLQTFTMNISQIYTSCKPTPSLLIVGTISAAGASPYANFQGAVAAISLGYTTDNPPAINNVVEVVAGSILAYSPGAQGTLTFPAAPVTPPGSNDGAPTIVLNPPPPTQGAFQVFTNPFYIDASTSTDPNKLGLTYMWTSDNSVNFVPSNTVPNPSIYFESKKGDYKITLTVTNSAGKVSTQTFTVQYLGNN